MNDCEDENFASVFGASTEGASRNPGVGERARGAGGGCISATAGGERSRDRRLLGAEGMGVGRGGWKSRDFYAVVWKCCQFRRNSRAIRTFANGPVLPAV